MKNQKLLSVIMTIIMLTSILSLSVCAEEAVRTIYAPDGREVIVSETEVDSYVSVGWYTFPVAKLYSLDGRSIVVAKSEVDAYKGVGWYSVPSVMMYAPDGRSMIISREEAPSYEMVGWYYEPVQTMFALDARSMVVLRSEINACKSLGWYLPEEYISIVADNLVSQSRYNDALIALRRYTEPSGEWYVKDYAKRIELKNKINTIFCQWMNEVGAPLGVVDYRITSDENGQPRVSVELRNLTDMTISSIEAEWTCFDANGLIATDYPGVFNGVVSAWAESEELLPGETATFTWTLTGHSQTSSISWPYPKKAVFTDGTIWQR